MVAAAGRWAAAAAHCGSCRTLQRGCSPARPGPPLHTHPGSGAPRGAGARSLGRPSRRCRRPSTAAPAAGGAGGEWGRGRTWPGGRAPGAPRGRLQGACCSPYQGPGGRHSGQGVCVWDGGGVCVWGGGLGWRRGRAARVQAEGWAPGRASSAPGAARLLAHLWRGDVLRPGFVVVVKQVLRRNSPQPCRVQHWGRGAALAARRHWVVPCGSSAGIALSAPPALDSRPAHA
jgi:hypothetical protein